MRAVALICTANRCRSVMAHAIFVAEAARRNFPIRLYSAGVYDFTDLPPVSETLATCLKFNTPVPKEEATWAGDLPLDSIDHFLVMEEQHKEILTTRFQVSPARVSLLGEFDPRGRGKEIEDPIGRDEEFYEDCYNRIRDCIANYLETTGD